jgi:DNA-binding transcriptional ArsR family regulator
MAKFTNEATATLAAKESALNYDYTELRKAVLVLRALNHKLRQKMIALIDQHGSITVSDIYGKLKMEQSVASQHLAILRRAGVVITQREGKFIYYSIDKNRISQIFDLAGQLS